MKKRSLFFVGMLLSQLMYAAQTKLESGKSVVVITPDLENISGNESAWIAGAVRDRFEANLRGYTDFLIVDNQNERKIKDLQKKSEGLAYDSKTAIEVGKLTSAKYAVFSTIRKAGSTYTISVSFTNLTNGTREAAVVSKGTKDYEELFNSAGCSVDELTIKLCEQLNITLTSSQRFSLQHGDEDLSFEEQINMSRREEENFKNMMTNLDREIELYSRSTDLSATAQKAKIEAERAMANEKLKASQAQTKRLMEEQEKRIEDAKKDSTRTQSQKKKRDELAKAANSKAELVRQKKIENESVVGQISIIENKKKALVEIRKSIKERADEINDSAKSEYEQKRSEILSKPYRRGELDKDGNPVEVAINNRNQQVEEERKAIVSRTEREIKELNLTVQSQDAALYKEIQNDYKILTKNRMASSLSNDLKVSFSSYDAKKASWEVFVYLYSEGILLEQNQIELKYIDFMGITNVPTSGTLYEEYLDNVDIYTSLFDRGDPILTFEMDYSVSAMSENTPSAYKFKFDRIRIKRTIEKKMVAETNLNSTRYYECNPKYDIRSEAQVKAAKIASDKEIEEAKRLAEEAERQRIAEQLAKDAKMERIRKHRALVSSRNSDFDQKSGGGAATSLRAGPLFSLKGNGAGFDIEAYIGLPRVFWVFQGGMTPQFNKVEPVAMGYGMFELSTGLGFNKRVSLGDFYPPNVFGYCSLGMAGFSSEGSGYILSSSKDSKKTVTQITTYFLCRLAAGIDLPLGNSFALYVKNNLDIIAECNVEDSITVGLAYTKLRWR